MSTERSEAGDDAASLTDQLTPAGDRDVLFYGPAMSGKRDMALELMVAAVTETGGRPFYVTTAGSATDARARIDARIPEGTDLPEPGVVACEGEERGELTRTVDTPGDLIGIAAGLTEMYDASRRSRRLGSRVLVDNVSALLAATALEPVYRFLHALTVRVAEDGGQTIATLDADGLAGGERPAITNLFDTVVEVRRHDSTDPEYRLHTDDDWHSYLPPETRP